MKTLTVLIAFFQLSIYFQVYSQEIKDPISKSIVSFIGETEPLFESTYVKSENGSDQKYTEFLISGIKSAPVDLQQIKALNSFAMVLASLSKEDAKAYGVKIGKEEEIRTEYQSFLYLGTIPISSEEEKLEVYLHAIKSVAFHLRVKEIPVYKNLEGITNYVEEELLKTRKFLSQEDANRINQIHLHFLFSIALENFSKFLSLGILEEKENLAFDQLATERAKAMPSAKNVSELSAQLKNLSKNDYLELDQKMVLLISEYLDLTKNLLGKVMNN